MCITPKFVGWVLRSVIYNYFCSLYWFLIWMILSLSLSSPSPLTIKYLFFQIWSHVVISWWRNLWVDPLAKNKKLIPVSIWINYKLPLAKCHFGLNHYFHMTNKSQHIQNVSQIISDLGLWATGRVFRALSVKLL